MEGVGFRGPAFSCLFASGLGCELGCGAAKLRREEPWVAEDPLMAER